MRINNAVISAYLHKRNIETPALIKAGVSGKGESFCAAFFKKRVPIRGFHLVSVEEMLEG